MDPTVFIVDDDDGLRQSIGGLLETVGLKTEPYPNAEAFLEVFQPDRPGCLVLDLRMPGMGGVKLQEALAEKGSLLPIIIVTAYADVPVAVTTIKAGALHFFEKPFSAQQLIDAIQEGIDKNRDALAQRHWLDHIDDCLAQLTKRESEVLHLLTQGMANKAIGGRLGISFRTVETHRARVMEKMEVDSLAELVEITLAHRRQSAR